MRIGVRDLLGKAAIRETTAALSDVADTILNAVFVLVEQEVRLRFGTPTSGYVLLGLGKLGGGKSKTKEGFCEYGGEFIKQSESKINNECERIDCNTDFSIRING